MSSHVASLVLIALGGALGGIGRHWVSGLVARRVGERFPWGTLAVNVSGAAAIGVLAALVLAPEARAAGRPALWLTLAVGVLGSYTTVSSFSLQTLALARSRERGRALMNVAASLGLCLALAAAGYLGATSLVRG